MHILNCCGLFEGKSPHPNPLPEGEGTLFGSPDQFRIRSSEIHSLTDAVADGYARFQRGRKIAVFVTAFKESDDLRV